MIMLIKLHFDKKDIVFKVFSSKIKQAYTWNFWNISNCIKLKVINNKSK